MNVSQGTDKKQFYQPAVDTISLILGLPTCIWLADETGKTLKIVAATGLSDEYISNSVLHLGKPSVASDVFKTEKTIVVPDIASDDRWEYKVETTDMGLKSAIVVPLRVEKKIVGVFDVYTHEVREFSAYEKILIEKLAAQVVASTIRNTHLFEQATNRAEALQKLHQIGGQILSAEFSAQGLAEVLRQVAQSAKDVLDADLVDVYRYVEAENRWILPPVLEGKRQGPEVVKDEIFEDDVVVLVVKDGQPIYTPNVQVVPLLTGPFTIVRPDSPDKRFVVREGILSSAAVPLKAAGETVGVMFVNYRTQQDFTPDQRETIELFANQAALAIYNARVYEQDQKRIKALEAINEVGQQLNTIEVTEEGLRRLLQQVAQQAKEVMVADLVDLYQYSPGRGNVVTAHVCAGERLLDIEPAEKVLPDDVVAKVLIERNPLFASDAQSSPLLAGHFETNREGRPNKRFVVREQIASTAAIPLTVGDEAVGVLFVNYRTPQKFHSEQQELIQLFANQAAAAIRNAQLHERLQIVNKVGQALTKGIRLREDEILKLIRNQAGTLMDTDNMYIALYDEATDTVRFGLAFVDDKRVDVEKEEGYQPRRAGKGKTEEIIRTKKPLFHATKVEAETWYIQPGHEEYTGGALPSWLGVPMMVGDRVLGVIATYHPTRDHVYSKDDLGVLQALANQAAIALDNARLYYDVNQRLQMLVNVGQKLSSGIQLKESEILQLIYKQSQRLTGTRDMYVALYDEDTEEISFELAMENGEPVEVGIGGWADRKANMQERGKTEEIILTGEPILHSTLQESQDWYEHPGRQEFLDRVQASYLGVPMSAGEKILGVLAIYDWEREYAYSESDQAILSSMASQAAIALDNATLLREAARRTKQLGTVQEITNAIQIYEELPAFLESILELSLSRLNAQAGTIQLLDRATNELVVHADVGLVMERKYTRVPLGQGVTGQAAHEKHAVYIPDTSPSKVYLPYLGQMRSEFAVPLVFGDEVIGVFNIEDPRLDAFDDEVRELCELIAAQVAIVIQQKLQLEKEQQKRVEAEQDAMLGRFTQDIAHYVKNQVGIIRLSAINLLNESELSESPVRQEELERIRRNADITIKLAQDLFKPYRRTEQEWVNVNWLIDEAFHLLGEREGIKTSLDLAPELPQIYIEQQGMVGVIQELIINAYKAVSRGGGPGWVCISSQRSADGGVEILFSNNGLPIPHEHWETIFNQFSGTEKGVIGREGFGLGLWSSRVFLRRQVGDIRVLESNSTQTTFIIHLPVPVPVPSIRAGGQAR